MIKAFVNNGAVFIWNAEDVFTLRTEHRIVGSLIGSCPRQKFQNTCKYLPLKLSSEEATLLSEKGVVQLVSNTEVCTEPDNVMKERYFKFRNSMCNEQMKRLKESRLKDVMEKIDVICKGQKRKFEKPTETSAKKRKLMESQKDQTDIDKGEISENTKINSLNIADKFDSDQSFLKSSKIGELSESEHRTEDDDDETRALSPETVEKLEETQTSSCDIDEATKKEIIDKEMSKLSHLTYNNCLVQLFTESPWKRDEHNVAADWHFPKNNNEVLRYAVFKDLWEKEYYLTSGVKFGGDYLVYAGDPVKFHALYIVFCIHGDQEIRADDLAVFGRLGNQVRKTVVLASINSEKKVEYISLNWASDIFKKEETQT